MKIRLMKCARFIGQKANKALLVFCGGFDGTINGDENTKTIYPKYKFWV